jgi:hypothetical protein
MHRGQPYIENNHEIDARRSTGDSDLKTWRFFMSLLSLEAPLLQKALVLL